MKVYVIVATKGRPIETYRLIDYLHAQTTIVDKAIVVGSSSQDIAGLDSHPMYKSGHLYAEIGSSGLCKQRNLGLNYINKTISDENYTGQWLVIFFDDDFRPANDWVEICKNEFEQDNNLVGLTGWVMADGAFGESITELESTQYLNGTLPATNVHSRLRKKMKGLYGCNMVYRGTFAKNERFDENLPLYGWQEDIDYSSRAGRTGTLIKSPECKGVHLGVTSGKTSGVRLGYSQVSNPVYLIKKKTMSRSKGSKLMCKNLISNLLNTILFNRKRDYFGRLCGNIIALKDFVTFKIHPLRVLDL